jgi:hypothetical protein
MDRMIAGIMADHEQHKRAIEDVNDRLDSIAETLERVKS